MDFMTWATFGLTLAFAGVYLCVARPKRHRVIAVANLIVGPLLIGWPFAVLLGLALLNFASISLQANGGSRSWHRLSIALTLIPFLILRSEWEWNLRSLLLSLSLSFFSLQQIGALVDVNRRNAPAPESLSLWLAFALFFPALVAGPIGRWPEFREQLSSPHPFTFARGIESALLLLQGVFKRMVFAAPLFFLAERFFSNPASYGPTVALIMAFLLRYAIWAEISSFTDWSRGLSGLLGVDQRPNFDRPFQLYRLTEFWRRWHMSLSSWLHDYVFVPLALGPMRRVLSPRFALVAALLAAFAALGLWHGLKLSLLVMGVYKGAGVLLSELADRSAKRAGRGSRFASVTVGVAFLFLFMIVPTLLLRLELSEFFSLVSQAGRGLAAWDPRFESAWAELVAIKDGPKNARILLWPTLMIAFAWEILQKLAPERISGPGAQPAFAIGPGLRPIARTALVFALFLAWLLFAKFGSNGGYVYVQI